MKDKYAGILNEKTNKKEENLQSHVRDILEMKIKQDMKDKEEQRHLKDQDNIKGILHNKIKDDMKTTPKELKQRRLTE